VPGSGNAAGTSPARQREGLGGRTLGPGLTTADQQGAGSFLETSSVSNLDFSSTFGFEVIGHRRLKGDGPDVWAMYRKPNNSSSPDTSTKSPFVRGIRAPEAALASVPAFGDRALQVDTGNMTRYRNYWIYSIGCFVVWGVLLAVVAAQGKSDKTHAVLLVFAGWCIGWVSTTFARFVYPPPKRWLQSHA
jgi:hypothetical protein